MLKSALGMTVRHLLNAYLLAQDGTELGDIKQVQRDPSGPVTGFAIETEDADYNR